MNAAYWITGFLLGATCTMLFMVSLLSNLKDENEALRERLKAAKQRTKGERSRRLDTEIALEDAGETIAYQRDELYRVKHPTRLIEYVED